ncbi:MAG: methionyl-tRNA formyltransferase [Acidobacteriota bacterium]|jgi:methionyl-tRNA formyltransferase|nr:methionyl-tRNA formyltransferase [Acidobacteriota bacterium]
MRVLFLGTPEFSAVCLRALLENPRNYDVCGVFTQPDRPSGRGHRLHASPVKELALARGIEVFQPARLRAEENRPVVERLRPDVIVTASYGQLVPTWMLRLSRLYPVNVHASLLPRWRGASPVARAILAGDASSGVSIIVMEEALDAGGVLSSEELPIPPEATAGTLMQALADVGARLMLRTLEGMQAGRLTPTPQDEARVTWAKKITRAESPVSWEKPAAEIHNQIRGLNPWPAASVSFRGERLSLWRSLPAEAVDAAPGTMLGVHGDAMRVRCGGGTALDLLEVQRPGKRRVSGRDFAAGARLKPGDLLR